MKREICLSNKQQQNLSQSGDDRYMFVMRIKITVQYWHRSNCTVEREKERVR